MREFIQIFESKINKLKEDVISLDQHKQGVNQDNKQKDIGKILDSSRKYLQKGLPVDVILWSLAEELKLNVKQTIDAYKKQFGIGPYQDSHLTFKELIKAIPGIGDSDIKTAFSQSMKTDEFNDSESEMIRRAILAGVPVVMALRLIQKDSDRSFDQIIADFSKHYKLSPHDYANEVYAGNISDEKACEKSMARTSHLFLPQ